MAPTRFEEPVSCQDVEPSKSVFWGYLDSVVDFGLRKSPSMHQFHLLLPIRYLVMSVVSDRPTGQHARPPTLSKQRQSKQIHYPFWFGGSASCFAASVTHPLDLGMPPSLLLLNEESRGLIFLNMQLKYDCKRQAKMRRQNECSACSCTS
jgi:hypothetical protein